jgi:STE24 endopeptidase
MSIDEIEAVVAHEIGHYRLGHIPKRLLISFLVGLGGFAFLNFLSKSEWFYHGLNLPVESMGSLVPLIVILSLYSGAFTYWLSPIGNMFSRKHEYEADKFAAISTGKGTFLSSALRKLYKKNKNFPLPDRWLAFFHHSHPSLLERERALTDFKL